MNNLICNSCGSETNFDKYDGRVCSKECNEELNLKRAFNTLGTDYEEWKRLKALEARGTVDCVQCSATKIYNGIPFCDKH